MSLNNRGIIYPSNAKRSHLIRLVEENSINRPGSPLDAQGAPSQDAPVQNNNGGDQRVMIDLVSKLSSTVQSLQQNVINLTSRVNSMNTQTTSSSVSTEINHNIQSGGQTNQANSSSNDVNNTSNFTLSSAMAAMSSSVSGPSATTTGIANQQPAPSYKRTRFGFSAESLPLVETISPQLRQQIMAGKDINLASILIPYYVPTEDKPQSEQKNDYRLQRSLSLGEFIQAFGIYKNVMCEAYPQRRVELDLYERDIIDMATRYPGKGFYEYHRQFSLMAASHLRFYNIMVDWSVRNNTLFCNIFANAKAQSCTHCHSTLHLTNFCAMAATQKTEKLQLEREVDSYGRKRLYHAGKEICNNFNGTRGCQLSRCRNAHICLDCRGEHARQNCTLAKNGNWPQHLGPQTHPK
ncbi:uncharacterized protein LOC128187444 [Crassostrea angulata]|uniref:uncharacterized protein LOC128187444 n=1 Tax=Magallana angulata TaxID=2784310 RepID=UPI0022B1B805|nr:uncharacterized protein LOC128187444 [Crassostrea angulata]